MKKILTLTALAVLTIALSASAIDDSKGRGEKKISGTIAQVDTSSRALTVADVKGANWQILWNDATKVMGGELKEGASVEVGFVESESRNVASWIRVQEAAR